MKLKIEVERHCGAIWADILGLQVWGQALTNGRTPSFPHPELKRWGIVREPGSREVCLYAGPLFAIVTPRVWIESAVTVPKV